MNASTPPHEDDDGDPPTIVAGAHLLEDDWLAKDVLATREADLRAHQIALTYSKYAIHLDDLIHGDESVRRVARKRRQIITCNTNWFHYATWGTVTITRNIAHQRPPQRLDDILPIALRRRLTPALIRERAANGQRVSRALAWSQRLIFITTAYTLKQFDEWMTANDKTQRYLPFELSPETKEAIKHQSEYELNRRGLAPRSAANDDALRRASSARKGERKSPVGNDRHLRPIQQAFQYYQQAANADEDDTRARLILGANVLLTAAEQDLAQGAVATVVNHMPQRFMNSMYRRTAKAAEMWTGVPRQIVGLQLPTRLLEVHDLVDTIWSRLMTDQVLVMTLPTETLRLGRDIPPRDPALPFYPPPLRHLEPPLDDLAMAADDEPRRKREKQKLDAQSKVDEQKKLDAQKLQSDLREIAEMVQSFDRTRANGRGSAARDWRLFADRMNWAVALMRSRQQDETLFWPPYSTEDETRIVDGQLPYRAGDPSELEVQAPSDYYLEG